MNRKTLIIIFVSVFAAVSLLWFFLFPSFLGLIKDIPEDQKLFQVKSKGMGFDYYVKYYDTAQVDIQKGIDSIFKAVEASVSVKDSNSIVSKFNKSDSCVQVDGVFLDLFFSSDDVYECTNIAFDPTVYTLSRLWGYGESGSSALDTLFPNVSDAHLRDSLILEYVDSASAELDEHMGFSNIKIDGDILKSGDLNEGQENFACKSDSLLKVDFSAIIRGYLVDEIFDYLFYKKKLRNFLVTVGGQTLVAGSKPDGSRWSVELKDLFGKTGSTKFHLNSDFSSMAICENYTNAVKIGDEVIAKTFDPRKYLPVNNGMQTVILFGQEGVKAEAFATALMVMGPNEARDFVEVNPTETLEAYFLYKDEKGALQTYASPGLAEIMAADVVKKSED
ncbi:MAG: FAD:protein FMN transferase [Flavobacteriales bacterium]